MSNVLSMPDVYLNSIAVVQGERIEQNDASTLGIADANYERIVRKTGVHSRPVAGPDQYTSDLAFAARNSCSQRAPLQA